MPVDAYLRLRLVVVDAVQESMWESRLVLLEDGSKVVVQGRRCFDGFGQFQDGLTCSKGRLVVVANLYIDHVDRTIQLAMSGQQVFAHGIKAALLACNDDVRYGTALLKPLGRQFDPPVAI